MKYRIELTDVQLSVILRAVDITMRAGMDQMDEISEWLASHGDAVKFDTSTIEGKTEFNNYIYARDDFRNVLGIYTNKHRSRINSKSITVRELETIYLALRHQEWLDAPTKLDWDVRGRKPMQCGHEPILKIERVE